MRKKNKVSRRSARTIMSSWGIREFSDREWKLWANPFLCTCTQGQQASIRYLRTFCDEQMKGHQKRYRKKLYFNPSNSFFYLFFNVQLFFTHFFISPSGLLSDLIRPHFSTTFHLIRLFIVIDLIDCDINCWEVENWNENKCNMNGQSSGR